MLVELESYYGLCCTGAWNCGTSVTSLLVKRKLTRGEGGEEGSRANVEDADRQGCFIILTQSQLVQKCF